MLLSHGHSLSQNLPGVITIDTRNIKRIDEAMAFECLYAANDVLLRVFSQASSSLVEA